MCFPHQSLLEDARGVGMRCDLLVQNGLRKEGLVDLVVSHASVAHHVDDAVLAELGACGKKKKKKKKKRGDAKSTM